MAWKTTVWIQTVEESAYLFIFIYIYLYLFIPCIYLSIYLFTYLFIFSFICIILHAWICRSFFLDSFDKGPKEEILTHGYRQNCWMCSRFVDLLGPLLLCLEIRQLWPGVILWTVEIQEQWKRGCRMLWSFLRKSPLWLCQKCDLEIDSVVTCGLRSKMLGQLTQLMDFAV